MPQEPPTPLPSGNAPRVTLRDVADAAGLAVPTVSCALRGTGTVSAKTVRRVREIARKLGYQPDPLLSAAGSSHFRRGEPQKTVSLAAVGWAGDAGVFAHYAGPAEHALHQLGYDLRLATFESHKQVPGLLRNLYHQGVQGLMLLRWHPELPLCAEWNYFSIILLEVDLPNPLFHGVRCTRSMDLHRLQARVAERGYRRLGCLVELHDPGRNMMDEMRRSLAQPGPLVNYPGVCKTRPLVTRFRRGSNEEEVTNWIREERPDAVIATTWGRFEQVHRIDPSIGFAAEAVRDFETVSGMTVDKYERSRTAVEQLDLLIRQRRRGKPPSAHTMVVPKVWHEGVTLPPRAV